VRGMKEIPKDILQLDGVKVEKAHETAFIYGSDMDKVLIALSKIPEISYLRRQTNLEDVFIKVTGRELRE